MIKFVSRTLKLYRNNNRFEYHALSLLESKHQEQHIKINPKLFHLYIDKLLKSQFNERLTVLIITDCYRTAQPKESFHLIINKALQNLQKFNSRISLVSVLNQMYHYRYNEKKVIDRFVRRAIEIKQTEDSGYSFYNLKLMILIDQLIGLEHYPEQVYRQINFKKFRPLTLAMSLELFYAKGLQNKYKIVDEIVDMFVACQSFIPFADVHHLSFAIRKIENPKFKQCYYRVRSRIQQTLNKKETILETDQTSWTSDEQLLQVFRDKITKKYSFI